MQAAICGRPNAAQQSKRKEPLLFYCSVSTAAATVDDSYTVAFLFYCGISTAVFSKFFQFFN